MRSSIEKGGKKLPSRWARRTRGPASRKQAVAKSTRLKPATKRSPAGKARAQKALKTKTTKMKAKPVAAASKNRKPPLPAKKIAKSAAPPKAAALKRKLAKIKPPLPLKKPIPPPAAPQPTHDEAAALKAFEAAHKEFSRGHFAEARTLFRSLVDKYTSVSEV